jgi:hypothetical protein
MNGGAIFLTMVGQLSVICALHNAWTRRRLSNSGERAALIYRNGRCLDSFQCVSGISLESLQNTLFPFASGGPLQYRKGFASPIGLLL